MKKIFYSIFIIVCISFLAVFVIAYGRGYRLSFREQKLSSTGILSVTSVPEGASIFLNGKLTSATNNSISIAPGWYDVRIGKTGYQSWEKRLRVQGEVVTRADALLIPTNPSLRALTVSGVLAPSLSPTGTKVAYIVPEEEASPGAILKPKVGIWIFELRSGPLGGIADPKQVFAPTEKIDWTGAQLLWSPDEKQLLLLLKSKQAKTEKFIQALQIFLDNNTPPLSVLTSLNSILADWEDTKKLKQDQSFTSLAPALTNFLKNNSQNILFSPDSNKIFYLATSSASLSPLITPPLIGTNPTLETRNIEAGKYYVYDIKEDKNFFISDQKSIATPLWYSDSKRIVMIENISIYIIDYDGTNKRVVYSGPFESNIVYPWTSAGKLVILTNLNKPKSLPNLYEIDIR